MSWEGARQATLLLAGHEADFWEVQYPIYGINVSCYRADSGTWFLEATTPEAGMAPPIPLLTCTYQYDLGLKQTYRYEYPRDYCDAEQLEFFDNEISDILTCFQGIQKYILEPAHPEAGSPISPGHIRRVQGLEGGPEETSYHLLTSDKVLYVIMSLSPDEVEGTCTGAVFRNQDRVPTAFLTLDFHEKTYRIKPYVGYETSRDYSACSELAAEILKNKKLYEAYSLG